MMQESDSDGAVSKLSANIENKCNENVASVRQDVQQMRRYTQQVPAYQTHNVVHLFHFCFVFVLGTVSRKNKLSLWA